MDLADLPAHAIVEQIAARQTRPSEVLTACLTRVEYCNSLLNAVVTLSDTVQDEAAELDRRLDRGEEIGPLGGVPVGIKDVTEVAGLRTTYGSTLYADHVPERDALVVARLRAAGALILGKTNTPEFAAGGNTFNPVFGRTRNPWNPERSAGGSTGGGAAALRTGMIALAQGTDLGGSLRIPASFCGVTGLRPSAGLVPTVPSDYLWDNLQVTGGMGRSALDVALFLQAVGGPSQECPIFQPAAGRDFAAAVRAGSSKDLRIAYCPDIAGYGVEDDIRQRCREAAHALRDAVASVEEVDLDLSFARRAFLALRGYWMAAHHVHRSDVLEQLGDNVRGNIQAGFETSVQSLGEAEQVRGRVWTQFRDFFKKYDHLLTPTMAVPPFPVEQNYPETIRGKKMETYVDWIAPTFLLSLTGLPVASVPVGLDREGLPVGMQIVGRPFGEEAVLALAAVVERLKPLDNSKLQTPNFKTPPGDPHLSG